MRFVKICRILAYSELCLFTYMQEFSSILSIKAYSQILKSTLCNPHIFTTLPYFQPWHIENQRYIQNPVKLSQGIFRTLPLLEQSIQALFNHIQTYAEPFVMLAHAKTWHIKNPETFRTLP